MARIKEFNRDLELTGKEKILGSDVDGATLNYELDDIKNYVDSFNRGTFLVVETDYSLVETQEYYKFLMLGNNLTFTINNDLSFEIGKTISIYQYGTGFTLAKGDQVFFRTPATLQDVDKSYYLITKTAVNEYHVVQIGATVSGSGAVDSVNGQTGVVVIDADDIDDSTTTNKFATAAQLSKINGVEAGADVTDAANVDAAGAVMNTDTTTAAMQFVVDEDDFASNSATKVPTQQSAKTYIDAVGKHERFTVACSDETTDLTTGTKVTFRMPYAMTLTDIRASVVTAPTGAILTVDVNENGTTILSTKLTIDASEKTSTTAATPVVISDAELADDSEITIDIDQIGSTIAGAGLKVTFIGTRT